MGSNTSRESGISPTCYGPKAIRGHYKDTMIREFSLLSLIDPHTDKAAYWSKRTGFGFDLALSTMEDTERGIERLGLERFMRVGGMVRTDDELTPWTLYEETRNLYD